MVELERAEAPASQFANFVSRSFIEREFAAAQKANKDVALSLQLELAYLEETAGDEPAAAATYLAAHNAFGSREALESLARLFERHGLYHNFLPIADALMLSAETTGEELRALSLKLRYLDSQKNYEEAERLARTTCERTELDANERAYFAVAWYYFARQSSNTDSALAALELRCSLEPLSPWRSQLELERLEYASVSLTQAAIAVEGMVDPARTLLGFLELVERRKEDPDANIVRAWIYQAIGALDEQSGESLPFWLSPERREAALALGLATLQVRPSSGPLPIAIPPSMERRSDLLHWLLAKYFRGEPTLERSTRELTFLLQSERPFVSALAKTALRVISAEGASATRDVALTNETSNRVVSSCLRIVDAWKANDYETLADALVRTKSADGDVVVRNQVRAVLYAAFGLREESTVRRISDGLLSSIPDNVRRVELATLFQTFARALAFWGWLADVSEVVHALHPLDDETLLVLVRARHASQDSPGALRVADSLADPLLTATFRMLLPSEKTRSESALAADLMTLAKQILDPETSRWVSLFGAARSPLDVHRRLWSLQMDGTSNRKADPYRLVLGISLAVREAELGENHHASRALALLANQTEDLLLGARLYGTAGLLDWRSGRRKDALRAFENGALLDEASIGPFYQWALLAESHLDPALRPIAAEGSNQLGENTTDSALRRFFLRPDDASLDALRAIVTGPESSWVDRMAASLAVFFSPDATAKTMLTAATTLTAHSRGAADLVREEVLRRLAGNHEQTHAFLQTSNDLVPSEASAFALLVSSQGEHAPRKEKADAWIALSHYSENEASKRDMLALTNWFTGTRSPSLSVSSLRISELLSGLANTEDPLGRALLLSELARRFPDSPDTLRFLAEAAWMRFAGGKFQSGLELFEQVLTLEPRDIAAWEGVRRCALGLGDKAKQARACYELGRLSRTAIAAGFFERAGELYLALSEPARSIDAFTNAFQRDPKRKRAFDVLFRLLRERKEHAALLELLDIKIPLSEDSSELAKLYWEQARALRSLGRVDEAFLAVEHVRMLSPNHFGALALLGEMYLKRELFEQAADTLSVLSKEPTAPERTRLTALLTAIDLYETKLDAFDKSYQLLDGAAKEGFANLAIRERLARASARQGQWQQAASLLEGLMIERPETMGRVEAARLAIAIYRDRLHAPQLAERAILRLAEELPGDLEAYDLVLSSGLATERKRALLAPNFARMTSLLCSRVDVANIKRCIRSAAILQDAHAERVTRSLLPLFEPSSSLLPESLVSFPSPTGTLSDSTFEMFGAPGDYGVFAAFFRELGPTITLAYGARKDSLGLRSDDLISGRGDHPLVREIQAWATAFNLGELDLYVGGADPERIVPLVDGRAALVIGTSVRAPLDDVRRSRLAINLARFRLSMVGMPDTPAFVSNAFLAVCSLLGVPAPRRSNEQSLAIEMNLGPHLSKKSKKALRDLYDAAYAQADEIEAWAEARQRTLLRFALLPHANIQSAIRSTGITFSPVDADRDGRLSHLVEFAMSTVFREACRAIGLHEVSR